MRSRFHHRHTISLLLMSLFLPLLLNADLIASSDYPLLEAAKKNDLQAVRVILPETPSAFSRNEVNRKGPTGDVALSVAAGNGNLDLVRLLVHHGAIVDAGKETGDRTPLIHASARGYSEVVKYLIGKGAEVNARGGGVTPLLAAFAGPHSPSWTPGDREKTIYVLLENGADINAQEESLMKAGWTPLMYAVMEGDAALVRVLLSKGARLDLQNRDNETALSLARKNGLEYIAQLLDSPDRVAKEALKQVVPAGNHLFVAIQQGHINQVKTLITGGADVNLRTPGGDTLLIVAADENKLEIVRLLLHSGADVNAKNGANDTALIRASLKGHRGVVKELLKAKADANATDKDNRTALMIACEKGDIDLVTMLLKSGADVNTPNKKGETALIVAIKNRDHDMARVLVQKGSTLSWKDKEGKSAWTYAFESNQKRIVDLLEKAGAGREYSGMIWDGYVSKQKDEFIRVVDTRREWSELWQRAFEKPAPVIDFEKYAVACVFLGYNAKWMYAIGFGGPEFIDGKLVISYGLHDMMLRLSGPFKAGGQYAMKVYEKKNGVEMVLQERGSTSQTRR